MRCLIVGQADTGITTLFSLISNALGKPAGYLNQPIASIPTLPSVGVVGVTLNAEPTGPLLSFAENFDCRIAVVRDLRNHMISLMLSSAATAGQVLENDRPTDEEQPKNIAGMTLQQVFEALGKTSPGFTEECISSISRDADFIGTLDDGWFILRDENLVRHELAALSQHLGIALAEETVASKEHAAAGMIVDWRNWFTPADIGEFRPLLDPLLIRLGYPADWDVPAQPAVPPAGGELPILRDQTRAIAAVPRIPVTPPAGLELFREEARLSRAAGMPIHLWWRDDDLIANSANFDALVHLAGNFAAPVLVAIIPGLASESLDVSGTDPGLVHFCQHGWKHLNHQPPGGGKGEFGAARDPAAITAEVAAGQAILARLLGDRRLPIFVPPWNAFDSGHLKILRSRGFTGLSTHGPRPQSFAVEGVRLANTHIDILRWDAPGRPQALPEADVFERLARLVRQQRLESRADPEPIGLLSHHRAMGSDAWALLDRVFTAIGDIEGISWVSPAQVFAPPASPG